MADRFRGRYRISSTRLQTHNYSSNGYYFLTICTKNRENYFGEILKDKIQLSKIGKIATNYWLEIPKHFPFVRLDEFVVMPNHAHGILIINRNDDSVETQNLASLQPASLQQTPKQNEFGVQSKNLASVVRGYKIGVKKYATMNNICFRWQPRFYDHVVRNEESLNRIRKYIKDNPLEWKNDRNNLKSKTRR